MTVSTKEARKLRRLEIRQLAEAGDAAALIHGLVAYLAAELSDFRLGCPVVAAAVASPDAVGVHAAAAEVFASWVDEIATALERDGRTVEDARTLAGFVVDGIEGAVVRAYCSRSQQPLVEAGRHLTALVTATA